MLQEEEGAIGDFGRIFGENAICAIHEGIDEEAKLLEEPAHTLK